MEIKRTDIDEYQISLDKDEFLELKDDLNLLEHHAHRSAMADVTLEVLDFNLEEPWEQRIRV